MAQGISAVLAFAVGVAITPGPIIAVILMLFSRRAAVNGPLFMVGSSAALAVIGGAAYLVAVEEGASSSETAVQTIAWGKIVLGFLPLLLAEEATIRD